MRRQKFRTNNLIAFVKIIINKLCVDKKKYQNTKSSRETSLKRKDVAIFKFPKGQPIRPICISQFQQCPSLPGVGTQKLSKCPGVGTKNEGKCPAPGIVAFQHAAILFIAVFFRVTHDGLSDRGTTRSLVTTF